MAGLEIVTSLLSGGLTGLGGVALQRFADYKTKGLELAAEKERRAHEVEMRKADAAIMAQEWAARTQVAAIEAGAKESVAAEGSFSEALRAESHHYSDHVKPTPAQAWALILLDMVRGAVRPGLTVYLCFITTAIYVHSRTLVGEAGSRMSPEEAVGLLNLIVNTVLYLTTTCVLFWFGARNKQEPPKTR